MSSHRMYKILVPLMIHMSKGVGTDLFSSSVLYATWPRCAQLEPSSPTYLTTRVIRPVATVLPPSRMLNLLPASMAIG